MKILWIEDQPKEIEAFSKPIQSEKYLSLDFAGTLSSALRKMKKNHYDVAIVDIMIPLGSGSILEKEFGLEGLSEMQVGAQLIEIMFDGTLVNRVNLESFSGIVVSSSAPTPEAIGNLTSRSQGGICEWSKTDALRRPSASVRSLLDILGEFRLRENSLFEVLKSDRDPPGFAQVQGDGSLPESEKAAIAHSAPELGLEYDDVKQLKNTVIAHFHDQNHDFARQAATIDAVLEALSENMSRVPIDDNDLFSEILVRMEVLEERLDAAVDGLPRSRVKLVDDLDERLTHLKRRLQNPEDIGLEHIHRLLRDTAERARVVDEGLYVILEGLWREARLFQSLKHSKVVRNSLDAMLAANIDMQKRIEGEMIGVEGIGIDVLRSLDSIISEHSAKAEANRCFIRRFFPEQPVVLNAELRDFQAVMHNLVDNAIKHSFSMPKQETWVDVSVEPTAHGGFFINVENWGSKIERTGSIYRPNQRGNASLAPGSGQGLAISKGVCERNGWVLSEKSRPANRSGALTSMQERQAFINTFTVEFT